MGVFDFFFFYGYGGRRDLHSFPTRRSSDLAPLGRGELGLCLASAAISVVWFEAIKRLDRKSTRLNSSHLGISYAVFCSKKKNIPRVTTTYRHFARSASPGRRCPSRRRCG